MINEKFAIDIKFMLKILIFLKQIKNQEEIYNRENNKIFLNDLTEVKISIIHCSYY